MDFITLVISSDLSDFTVWSICDTPLPPYGCVLPFATFPITNHHICGANTSSILIVFLAPRFHFATKMGRSSAWLALHLVFTFIKLIHFT